MNRIILNETSYFGAGCRSVIAVEAARRGFKKAFFVTLMHDYAHNVASVAHAI